MSDPQESHSISILELRNQRLEKLFTEDLDVNGYVCPEFLKLFHRVWLESKEVGYGDIARKMNEIECYLLFHEEEVNNIINILDSRKLQTGYSYEVKLLAHRRYQKLIGPIDINLSPSIEILEKVEDVMLTKRNSLSSGMSGDELRESKQKISIEISFLRKINLFLKINNQRMSFCS